MRCCLNKCDGLHLLSPHPRFLRSSLALSQLPALALPTFCLRSRSAPGLCAQAVPIYHPFPAKQKKSPQALFLFRLFLVLRAALPPLRWQRRRWQLSCLSACRQTPWPYAPNTSRAIVTDACTSAAFSASMVCFIDATVVVISADSPTSGALVSRAASTTVCTGTSRPRSITS